MRRELLKKVQIKQEKIKMDKVSLLQYLNWFGIILFGFGAGFLGGIVGSR